jgi:hypothetical protein
LQVLQIRRIGKLIRNHNRPGFTDEPFVNEVGAEELGAPVTRIIESGSNIPDITAQYFTLCADFGRRQLSFGSASSGVNVQQR